MRANFRFGAFIIEYRTLRPGALVLKIYAADFPFAFTPGARNVTMRPIILQTSPYAIHQRRRGVVIEMNYLDLCLGRTDDFWWGIFS